MDVKQFVRDERALRLIVKSGILIGCFLVAVLVLVYPVRFDISECEDKILDAKSRIEEQRLLSFPLSKIALANNKLPKLDLAVPKLERLSRQKVFDVTADIENAAHKAGMEPLDVVVDSASIRSGEKEVSINAVFAGKSSKIRALYIELAKLPYLVGVKRLDIRPVQDEIEALFVLLLGVR